VLSGPLRGARWIVGSGDHGYWIGTYEHYKQRQFAAMIRPNGVAWDVGANVGLYTMIAARIAGRVVAIEPLPENVAYLAKHLSLNGISNVDLIQAAVCDRSGVTTFNAGPNRCTGRIGRGQMKVRTITLDSLPTPWPDVIKIDVEGAEYNVLQGAETCLSRHPVVFLATHSEMLDCKCRDFLQALGYRVRSIGSHELLATR
jgi:FkbM family methyltransferase